MFEIRYQWRSVQSIGHFAANNQRVRLFESMRTKNYTKVAKKKEKKPQKKEKPPSKNDDKNGTK